MGIMYGLWYKLFFSPLPSFFWHIWYYNKSIFRRAMFYWFFIIWIIYEFFICGAFSSRKGTRLLVFFFHFQFGNVKVMEFFSFIQVFGLKLIVLSQLDKGVHRLREGASL